MFDQLNCMTGVGILQGREVGCLCLLFPKMRIKLLLFMMELVVRRVVENYFITSTLNESKH